MTRVQHVTYVHNTCSTEAGIKCLALPRLDASTTPTKITTLAKVQKKFLTKRCSGATMVTWTYHLNEL